MFKVIIDRKLNAARSNPGSYDYLGDLENSVDRVENLAGMKELRTSNVDLHDNLNSPFAMNVARVGMFPPLNPPFSANRTQLKEMNARWKNSSPTSDETYSENITDNTYTP